MLFNRSVLMNLLLFGCFVIARLGSTRRTFLCTERPSPHGKSADLLRWLKNVLEADATLVEDCNITSFWVQAPHSLSSYFTSALSRAD